MYYHYNMTKSAPSLLLLIMMMMTMTTMGQVIDQDECRTGTSYHCLKFKCRVQPKMWSRNGKARSSEIKEKNLEWKILQSRGVEWPQHWAFLLLSCVLSAIFDNKD